MKVLALLALLTLAPFLPPAQDTAGTVYLFRVEEADKLNSGKPKVYINDKHVLSMPEQEFVGLRLPPGKYVFRMQNKHTATPLNVEAGRVYYIRVSEVPASGFLRNLFLIQPEQALHQMRDTKPLEAKNVKDKTLQTTAEKPTAP